MATVVARFLIGKDLTLTSCAHKLRFPFRSGRDMASLSYCSNKVRVFTTLSILQQHFNAETCLPYDACLQRFVARVRVCVRVCGCTENKTKQNASASAKRKPRKHKKQQTSYGAIKLQTCPKTPSTTARTNCAPPKSPTQSSAKAIKPAANPRGR